MTGCGRCQVKGASSPRPSPHEEEREKISAREVLELVLHQSLGKTQKSSLQTATVFPKTLWSEPRDFRAFKEILYPFANFGRERPF